MTRLSSARMRGLLSCAAALAAAGALAAPAHAIIVKTPNSLDGDRRADLVLGDNDHRFYGVISSGSSLNAAGSGEWLSTWSAGTNYRDVGDFNGDGKTDLLVGDKNNNTFAVAIGDGARFGASGSQLWLTTWSAGTNYRDVGDFNGDGKDDLVVGDQNTNRFAVALSDGTKFGAPGTQGWLDTWSAGTNYRDVGDFNGDGKDDLLVGDQNTNRFAVALSDGTKFGAPGTGTWLSTWSAGTNWRGVGDFNGDGKDDLIVGDQNTNVFAVALSDGTKFGAPGTGSWLSTWSAGTAFRGVGDFNGDGKDDLLVADGTNAHWAVALSDGTKFGAPGTGLWMNGYSPNAPSWVSVTPRPHHKYYADADAVIAAIRGGSDAAANDLRAGLNSADLAAVTARMDATSPSSRTYGGANWKVDTETEAEAVLDVFAGASGASQDSTLAGLAPGDTDFARSQIPVIYSFQVTPESSPSLSDPAHEDGSALTTTEIQATAAGTSLRCRRAYDGEIGERRIQGIKKKGGDIEDMALLRLKVGFCWKKSAFMARPNSKTPFLFASGTTLNGFGKLGYRISYGGSAAEAAGRRIIQQKTVIGSSETVAYFAQEVDVLLCEDVTTGGEASVTVDARAITATAGANVSKNTSGCDLVGTWKHQIFGKYNGSASGNLLRTVWP